MTTEANGLRMHYRVRGSGPPLLCIMGFAGNSDWWPEDFLQVLEKHYTLILIDNRGAGRTGDPGGFYSISQMADDAAHLLKSLYYDNADVIGISMGGMIAQEFAIRHPHLIQRLVLVATSCGHQSTLEMIRSMRRFVCLPWKLREHMIYLLFSQKPAQVDPAVLNRFSGLFARNPITGWAKFKQYLAILRHDTIQRLYTITSPTLIVAGGKDLMVPPEHSVVLAKRMPHARLTIIPGASHGIMGYGAQLAELILDFLSA